MVPWSLAEIKCQQAIFDHKLVAKSPFVKYVMCDQQINLDGWSVK